MLEEIDHYSDSQRLELQLQVNIASEILAPYWSIKNFVHHNPLHEIEYLHFEEALTRAQQLLGGRGYLENETYRRFYSQGRISSESIDTVLSSSSQGASVTLGSRTVAKFEVLRTHLLHGVSAPASENLYLLIDRSPQRENILKLANHVNAILEHSTAELDAQRFVQHDTKAITRSLMFSQWCDVTLGSNLTQFINDELTKWCAAFVDEGQAAWELPGREKTLYGVWKSLSLKAPCPDHCENTSWLAVLKAMPDSPEDCILQVINDLEIPESHRKDYLALHLAALPGWTAFLKWRAQHSGYQWQQAYPADLTQYLAIRLTFERYLVNRMCQMRLGIKASYRNITSYMEDNPLVYFMLRQRFENKLTVALSQKLDRLWLRKNPAKDLQALALQFIKQANDNYCDKASRSAAWELLAIANCLKLSIQDLLESSPEELRIVLNWLKEFPQKDHGKVWLRAMETNYQERLVDQISTSIKTNSRSRTDNAEPHEPRPQSQAVFCIDVRSEPFRRHLESVGRNETLGFAGFFICFIRFQSIDSEHETDQFPVIMKPRNIVREVPRPSEHHKLKRFRAGSELLRSTRTLLHNLKEHFITPFVTVESLGWFYSLPFVFKTVAALPYQKVTNWMRRFVKSPVATTLTLDKLSHAEANEMVIGNQLAIIRKALQERFSLSGASLSADLVEMLRQVAMDEQKSVDGLKEKLPELSTEEIHSFVQDLRLEYRIIPRGASNHLERITRTGFTLEEQVFTIETALRMMGLTDNFARIVLICGHGSTSDNNPFESALDCGACGGNEGQANARTFAAMANKVQVREILSEKGINIPADTHFVPAQINTTTDVVELLDLEDAPTTHRLDLARLSDDLEEASRLTSAERCRQFPELTDRLTPRQAASQVLQRSADWSQVRPEWGLSGNASFIIARREITRAINLEGRAFLHSYDYLTDPGGKLLEIIMTAPQVVTQWINMEHYFSAVDNEVYGSGSKVYHNVAGQIGVMSGTKSDLRTGLPWQTVMSGNHPYHIPLRLTTVVEAPRSTIDEIIARHDLLKRFYHNEWVYLFAFDRTEEQFYRYSAAGRWQGIPALVEEKEIGLKQSTSTIFNAVS
ncbi:MAG: DUF2309 domain-containing protein [Candidatus Melainabacteria bacterium]|nr:DUF2309 domain-containing protein [Candidatus Melainabacteria bacterium]